MRDPFPTTTDTEDAPAETEEPAAAEAPTPAAKSADAAAAAPEVPVSDNADEDEDPPPYYANPGEWVEKWLLPNFRRELGGSKRRWDPNWWRYEEVGGALEALWQAWEHLRLQSGTAHAVFYRDYLYPIMDRLTAPDGPFWNFHESPPAVPGNTIPPVWETSATPKGWYREKDDPREN